MEIDAQNAWRAEINRLNALKSTGPKTEAVKRKALSLNTLRHGLTGQTVVLPTEDLEQYNRFTQAFREDLKPKGMLEHNWHNSSPTTPDAGQHRARALENNLFVLGIDEKAESIQTENAAVQVALALAQALREQTHALFHAHAQHAHPSALAAVRAQCRTTP